MAAKDLPTTGDSIPEFQFTLQYHKDDYPNKGYALVRHIASGKVYDSRDCPDIETSLQMCKEVVKAFWFMFHDQGRPQTNFYMDVTDGPNFKPQAN